MTDSKQDLSRTDDQALSQSETATMERQEPLFTPRVDIFETEEALVLTADFPGVDKDNLTITVEKNVLTLSGRPATFDVGERRVVQQSFQEGRFHREFVLSHTINQDKITADLRDGVLVVNLPKLADSQPKSIKVRQS